MSMLFLWIFCKVCCVLVVEMFSSFFPPLSLRVIISTYEPLYNYRNFNFLLLLWTEKIFMAMNKHWQLCSYFPFVFIPCKYICGKCLRAREASGSAKLKISPYIYFRLHIFKNNMGLVSAKRLWLPCQIRCKYPCSRAEMAKCPTFFLTRTLK